jgi:hypothetical protein
MNAQEQQMLQGLIDRVRNTQLPGKDPEAEGLIQSSLGSNPDALYILAQTVLVQQYALAQAQRQMAQLRAQNEQLRQQAAPPAKHTSFLGSLLGRDEDAGRPAAPPPPPQPYPPRATSGQPAYTPVPNYPGVAPGSGPAPGGWGQPAAYPTPGPYPDAAGYGGPSQGGGFLRSALQTATGVAAGALAFEGVESLMHGFGHAAGYGTEFAQAGGFGAGGPREEVINNYYGGAAPGEGATQTAGEHSTASSLDSGTSATDLWSTQPDSTGAKDDIWNASGGDGARFDDASTGAGPELSDANYAGGQSDSAGLDDSGAGFGDDSDGVDDSGSLDDSSGMDDSGGFDDSGSDDSGSDDSGSGGF